MKYLFVELLRDNFFFSEFIQQFFYKLNFALLPVRKTSGPIATRLKHVECLDKDNVISVVGSVQFEGFDYQKRNDH